nr:hypothetical protein [Sphingomonas faeni]
MAYRTCDRADDESFKPNVRILKIKTIRSEEGISCQQGDALVSLLEWVIARQSKKHMGS